MAEIDKDFNLEAGSELRFEIKDKDGRVQLILISGFAEIFGAAMVKKKTYEFVVGANVAIFTQHGCVLHLNGKTDLSCISKETSMGEYLNCHSALEKLRVQAEQKDERGPVVMVVGPKDVGKSTLCRILLNYAVRLGRRPLYVDTDVGQGDLAIPGTMCVIPVEKPISIEYGLTHEGPLVYHFGYKDPSRNSILYKTVLSKMARVTLESMNVNKGTKYSGIVINTCGWVTQDGYANLSHTARVFKVNEIFVLDEKQLYNNLLRDMPSFINVVFLSKSCGVVPRSRKLRADNRDQRVKDYFYGSNNHTFSIEVQFADLKLYKIGASSMSASFKPIDIEAKNRLKTKLVPVKPSYSLLNYILAVTYAKSIEEDVIGKNVAGYICVTGVDMERQSITMLSIRQGPLPNTLLLLSDIQASIVR